MTSFPVERVLIMRRGGHVRRFHQYPHLGDATVAEHTFQMLNLLFALHPCPTIDHVLAVQLHDSPYELFTGDVPSPVKRNNAEIRAAFQQIEDEVTERWQLPRPNMTANVVRWLNTLDALEGLLWCDDQAALGNTFMSSVRSNYRKYLNDPETPPEVQLFMVDYDKHTEYGPGR